MKKWISIAMVLFSGSVTSDDSIESKGGLHELCKTVAGFSVSTMRERQYGTPIIELLDKVSSDEEWVKEVVYIAYEYPLEKDAHKKESVIVEFGNDSYLSCVDSFD
ncbi:hypothetical protein [Alcanivorax sp.]|jgi:hypothetical protein|uniref:hypothetical protein n=1 Tax=Alcanivorax sp. TaxID=1872427 RepID=UPI0025BF7D9D|nr:hypothetical protein [Alcanivorax sp.]